MASKKSRAGKRSPVDVASRIRFLTIATNSLIVIGVGLIIASASIQTLPPKTYWNTEQATALKDASVHYHNQQFDQSISKSELKEARDDFEALNGKLERAKLARSRLPKLLRWFGIGSVCLGLVVLIVIRSNED